MKKSANQKRPGDAGQTQQNGGGTSRPPIGTSKLVPLPTWQNQIINKKLNEKAKIK